MQEINYVEFRKERDLGSIITDTFKFIRLEWKPFFSMILKVAIVPILLAIASLLYYSYAISKTFTSFSAFDEDGNNANIFGEGATIFVAVLLLFVFYLIAYVMINIASLYYLKSYIENKGDVKFDYVKTMVGQKFWSFIGLGILVAIIVFVSAILCGFPAIYTGVVLSLASSILVFSEKTVMDAIGDSFSFIKGHWWETFGVMIVVGILVTILGYIFQIPAFIYQMIQGFSLLGNEDPTEILSLTTDPIYMFLNVIATLGQFIFYTVTLISNVLIFFDINEQKNASGTFEQIDNLGR